MHQTESLYIHWPFCTSKCYYCDFVALEQHSDFQDAYHETLLKEIKAYAQLTTQRQSLKTIFIGGGTPSLYPHEKMQELFDLLHKFFDMSAIEEITLEANPADVTEENADFWESVGINRISCGVQVLSDPILQKLNRRQRTVDVYKAASILPKYFNNISMDLIIGLPEVTEQTWVNTITTICAWPIQHISIYFLTVHEKTPLYYKISKKELSLPNEEALLNQYEKTISYLADFGFQQYEISNFAKEGFSSLHNKRYWDRYPYKGFGIGAASFDGSTRTVNEKNLTNYLSNGAKNIFIPKEQEVLTPEQITLEKLMLSLRQNTGMNIDELLSCVTTEKKNLFMRNLDELQSAGLLLIEKNNIKLTLRGMILENEIILRLI